jgi:hypothetical protein
MTNQMTNQKIERASCRFIAEATGAAAPTLRLEVFHPVPALAEVRIEFELLSGTTLPQAKKLAESINERIIGIGVSATRQAPSI